MIIILTILLLFITLILLIINYINYNNEKLLNISNKRLPILFINNCSNESHFEIIESIILKYKQIFKITHDCQIYLNVKDNIYKTYIKKKYNHIILKKINNYDYFIECTFYPKDINKNYKNLSNHVYICHEFNNETLNKNNIFYLTPLSNKNYISTNILPYSNIKIKPNYPIYVIQGSLIPLRRDINLLLKILNDESLCNLNFKIKILGKNISSLIMNHKNKHKLIIKKNLNFIDYHKQFSDVYCIMTLISKSQNPQYYKNKLTSSINYALGYNLKCLIDINLYKIYKLENSYIYNNDNDFLDIFKKSIFNFQKKELN